MNQDYIEESGDLNIDAAYKSLEELVLDNADLEKLESLLSQFNIFEAVGAVRQEVRHSDFLAFLLNPQATHGLGDVFLKKLLQKSLSVSHSYTKSISPIDFDIWSLDAAVVQREWHHIDILITDETNKLVVIVENKVDSSEHSDQLNRYWRDGQQQYPGWSIIGLYLSPEGQTASHTDYVSIDYEVICSLVETLAANRASTLGTDVRTLMLHYAQMLRRHIVNDSDIAQLCRRIYFKHQKALDLIYEHRPDLQTQISEILQSLVEAEEALVLDRYSKSQANFALREWDVPLLLDGAGWTKSGRILLFEFRNSQRDLKLKLYVGPGGEGKLTLRQNLFDMANVAPLKPSAKQLSSKWNQIYVRPILTSKDYESEDLADIENKVRVEWSKFLQEDLPRIRQIIDVRKLEETQLSTR